MRSVMLMHDLPLCKLIPASPKAKIKKNACLLTVGGGLALRAGRRKQKEKDQNGARGHWGTGL
jgi:hypothetical protein